VRRSATHLAIRMAALILTLFAIQAAAPSAEARRPTAAEESTFARGNQAYEAGDFAAAVAAYEELLVQGVTGEDLHYNLGNANLKLGRLGPAILNYRRALRADPRDADARANLDYARRRTQDARPLDLPDPLPWLTAIRPGAERSAWLYLLAFNLAAVAFGATRLLRDPPAALKPVFGVALAVAILFGLVCLWEIRSESGRREGVVMAPVADVKTGPGDSYTVAFQVHEGTEVDLGRTENGWTEVSVASPANELKGWVAPGAVEAIP
jgi:tetratricopeptide (TPR) repeat protein